MQLRDNNVIKSDSNRRLLPIQWTWTLARAIHNTNVSRQRRCIVQ